MSQVIGQVWREVVGCRNWPVMRVPQFIALRRNSRTNCYAGLSKSHVELTNSYVGFLIPNAPVILSRFARYVVLRCETLYDVSTA